MTCDPSRRRLAGYYALGSVACVLLASLGGAALWLCWPASALTLVAAAYLALGPAAFQKRSDGTLSPAAFGLLAPLLGRLPGGVDLDRLGVAAIVDVSAELPCPRAGLAYFNVPMLDLVAPSPDQLDAALHAIRAAQVQGPVLVCCALGFSRSALAVAAWLLADAEAMIRRAKPAIVLGPAQRAALAGWWGKAP